MSVKVQKVELSTPVFCVSDIHGHLDLLKEGLKKANFTSDDTLIVLGDMVEKGPQNLAVLRYLMHMPNAYVVQGNCEVWILDLLEDPDTLKKYLPLRKESLFWDMMEEMQFVYDDNVEELIAKIKENYQEELQWIANLPVILETDTMLFVHAGIKHVELEKNSLEDCLIYSQFEILTPELPKYVMVGHLPAVNYSTEKPSCNPRIHVEKKVISIDGGMGVKSDGQLNVFVIDKLKPLSFHYVSIEDTPKLYIKKTQEGSTTSRSITWIDNQIQIVEENKKQYKIKHLSSGYTMWVDKEHVFTSDDGYHVYDITDYRLPLHEGEWVYVYKETKDAYYVKKDGVLGWYYK